MFVELRGYVADTWKVFVEYRGYVAGAFLVFEQPKMLRRGRISGIRAAQDATSRKHF